jgi:Peptidase_G2, IMC autoproteolytic cleavage domain
MIVKTTINRSYPKPDINNSLQNDVANIESALDMIDTDVQDLSATKADKTTIEGTVDTIGEIKMNTGRIHFSNASKYGMTANELGTGLWLETGSQGYEGGLFLSKETACLWSQGHSNILNVYDEDDHALRFKITNTGDTYCDGSFHGGGADYAEYFESINGESIPVGSSVTLEQGKIRVAMEGDTAIGIISGNATVVGNNPMTYPKAFLQDDYGCPIMEEYHEELLDKEGKSTGEMITRKRPKSNPDYNPNQKYTERKDRPEWNCVGLLGQVPLTKGQLVAPGWIKIKDISDRVELWLVK